MLAVAEMHWFHDKLVYTTHFKFRKFIVKPEYVGT